jgi:hypothetical protein
LLDMVRIISILTFSFDRLFWRGAGC